MTATLYGAAALLIYVFGAMSGWWACNTHLWFHRMRHGVKAMVGFMKLVAISVGLLMVGSLVLLRMTGLI